MILKHYLKMFVPFSNFTFIALIKLHFIVFSSAKSVLFVYIFLLVQALALVSAVWRSQAESCVINLNKTEPSDRCRGG